MALLIALLISSSFALGWYVSKTMNTPKKYPAGAFAIYSGKQGPSLIRLSQDHYHGQPYLLAYTMSSEKVAHLPHGVNVEKVRFYTVDGEVVNEANWNK